MNGNFWGHLVKAAGLALVGGGEDEQQPTRSATASRRVGSYAGPARKKGCCNAKRPSVETSPVTGATTAPIEGAFSGVRAVRPKRGT